jgi:hypothetical protein
MPQGEGGTMGWASGGDLYRQIIEALKRLVPDDAERARVHKMLIPLFESADWDTQDECLWVDPAFDDALFTLHPEWRDDD